MIFAKANCNRAEQILQGGGRCVEAGRLEGVVVGCGAVLKASEASKLPTNVLKIADAERK